MSANSKGPARIRFCAGFSCLRHWARHHTNCVGTSRIPLFVGCGGAGLCSSAPPDRRSLRGLRDPLRCPWAAAGPNRNRISAARSEVAARPAGPGCGARGRRLSLTETGSAPPDQRTPRSLRNPLRCPWAAAESNRNRISAARSEAAARPAGPGRASRRGTERSSVAKSRRRAGLAAAGDLAAVGLCGIAIRQKVVAPRKTWGPPLMRSLA